MSIYNFELDFLPTSVNASYRTLGNKVYKSRQLIEFQNRVISFFENKEGFEKLALDGNLSIDITFELKSSRKRDIDNMLKSLIDSLEGILYDNDSQIFELRCRKVIGCDVNKTKVVLFKCNS